MGWYFVFGTPLFARRFTRQTDIARQYFQLALQLVDSTRLIDDNFIEIGDRFLQMREKNFQFDEAIAGIFHR
jgi:hypothetical protein